MHLQPQQQRILRLRQLLAAGDCLHRFGKVIEVCPETAAILLRPSPVSGITNPAQQLRVVSRGGKLHIVKTRQLVKIQKFLISLISGRILFGRKDPLDITRNPGRAKMPQDTDSFIALLYIEITQIFIALNGRVDSLVA